jgi:thiamine biosynthesis lipoprotein
LKLIEATPGVAARFVRKPGEQVEVFESTGWKSVPRAENGAAPESSRQGAN